MQDADIPGKFTYAFGSGASGTYIRAVPATTADPVAASQLLGFPSATFTPTGSGGTAPDGRDFNGILNQISGWDRWQQAGGPVAYDSVFQAAVGGYPKGAVIQSATTFGKFWMSTTENNVTDPDASGAGWTAWTFGSGLSSAVTSITAGLGLSGGTITGTGTIAMLQASTSQLGGVKVDGTSIIISGSGVISATTGGSGSVNSVGLSMPAMFTVSGSPVTSTGTLTATLASQSANMFLAGPTSGGATAPTFRAIGSGDLPAATASQRGAVQVDNITTYMTGNVISAVTGGSGTVTSVQVSGASTGLSFTGGPITSSGTITLTGTLGPGHGGTGITSLGGGIPAWLGTPSSANLAAAMTDKTGTGLLVFATAPTFTSTITISSGGINATGTINASTEVRSSGPVTAGGGGRGIRGNGATALDLYSGDGGSATLTVSGMTCVAFTPTSDARLKSDIQSTFGQGLEKMLRLKGHSYTIKGLRSSGVLAQEVQEVLPDLVHANGDGYLSVNYDGLWAYAIEAIRELSANVEELRAMTA